MKISYQWLCELVPGLSTVPARDVADKLTMAGLEVEALEDQAQRYKGIVVGEVLSVEPHPNADKLRVCKVNMGQGIVQVVCGAPNVAAGKKYPLATVGTVFEEEGLEIKPVKLRGVESLGMMCSQKELGLSNDHAGLLELGNELVTGQAFAAAFGLDDVIFELNITPNRGDALSHWGVARDVAAITGLQVCLGCESTERGEVQTALASDAAVKVVHLDQKACGRFTASVIGGVTVAPSPSWLSRRLESLGVRSINNVVDATNYIMLLTGHPVHAYDAAFIKGQEIRIYSLEKAMTYKTLDSIERSLEPGDLVIADTAGPVGLAGIMGGENSEIRNVSKDLILEVAFFEPETIRRTSRRLGLQTESAYRFARFVNPDTVFVAHGLLRDLIVQLAGGQAGRIMDSYPAPFKKRDLAVTNGDILRILGIVVPKTDVMRIFSGLGCEVLEKDGAYRVSVPLARSDLERPIDLIEEVARIHGLGAIPAEMPVLKSRSPQESPGSRIRNEVTQLLVDRGFYETIHYSFGDAAFFRSVLRPIEVEKWITLKNPLSEDLAVLRPSLLPQLIKAHLVNQHKVEKGFRYFELRNVYQYDAARKPLEKKVLAFLYAGVSAIGRNRFGLDRVADFFDGRGLLEELFVRARLPVCVRKIDEWPFHSGQAAHFWHGDHCVAKFGALHPELHDELKIKHKLFYAELDYDYFALHFRESPLKFEAVNELPSVFRDLSLSVDKAMTYQQILDVIASERTAYLKDFELFAEYEGENIGRNNKSLTFSMRYEPKDKSLTDEDVNKIHFELVEKLGKRLGVVLR